MSSKINHHHKINGQIFPQPCPHLADFRTRNDSKPFRALQACLHIKPPGGRAAIRRDPYEVPRCGACGDASKPRLYACMTCACICCHAPPHSSHAAAHAASRCIPPGHEIAVDVDRAELFCCACRDQVYDRDFDAAVVLAHTTSSIQSSKPENLRKRRRIDYRPWSPDLRERALMVNNASPIDSMNGSNSNLPMGLRGLNNLGNTCFMNSVLQALFHTPPLRNYFLSDRHNRYYCQSKNGVRLCLACDMDAMFSAVFSGDRTPYSPAKFLYSWWQHASNLASYEQQDAHEFFISMLDGIHEKVEKDQSKPRSQGNGECCIAHRVFSGILRSDVMCMACGFTSTTYDPCVDFSLDLEPNQGGSAKTVPKSNHSCNGEADSMSSSQNCGISTLMGCLDRFTRPERLGSDQKFFCQQCQVRQESLKQMSIRKLPLVSCFHIKRFEHSSVRKMSRKVDRYLQFPLSLNMTPYLSSSILRGRFGNRCFPYDGDESDGLSELSSEFELFAVVTHTGKLDAGHYVTYLRLSNQWYKCDDAWITQVNENIVRAAQGYMMFYVQKMFYYKASEKQVVS
ncbi:ubiquitin C-terminal hydrolase 22-like [Pistacia vera]|uniref:ubiquitin C-terminal hydrolase 22-like n=1 Tax=Pistacia vera TaxID=55513 RepID=UPI0012635029|nr:ubiquitin C-terminal hydrolase 22-like [Pistacia vera]